MITQIKVFKTRISRLMAERFSKEEIDATCFELGVNPQEISGETLSEKIRGLITYFDNRGRLPELLDHIRTQRPNQPWPIPSDDDEAEPPFRGLDFFTENDEAIFFGREVFTKELISHLNESRFLAIFGASGSGKSSIVRAGLIPALRRGESIYRGQKSDAWLIHVITPTDKPLTELATELTRNIESLTAAQTLKNNLWENVESLDLWLRRELSRQTRLVLVIDQFEELFTLCNDTEERRLFIENLVYAVQSGRPGLLSLVLTLRADFYEHAMKQESMLMLLEKRQRFVKVIKIDELRQSIVGPLENTPWEYQPGLVDTILQDLGAVEGRTPQSEVLPLLSHALLETWKRREEYTLTLAGYQEAGGVRKAIAHTADDVYEHLTSEEQAIARNIFLRLTELGEGTEDTRRRAQLTELLPQSSQKAEVQNVLEQLVQARLVTIREDSAEVVHEALIREWPRLRIWLNENREQLKLLHNLTQEANNWKKNDHDKSYLYRGLRLTQVEQWVKEDSPFLNELEREFIEACLTEKERVEQKEIEQANKLEIALENFDLYRRERQRSKQLEVLYETGQLISSSEDLEKTLENTAKQALVVVNQSVGAAMSFSYVSLEEDGMLKIVSASPPSILKLYRDRIYPHIDVMDTNQKSGIPGQCFRTGEIQNIPDVLENDYYFPISQGIRSHLSVPLIYDAMPIGVISIESSPVNAFSEADQEMVGLLAKMCVIAIKNAHLYAEIKSQQELSIKSMAEEQERIARLIERYFSPAEFERVAVKLGQRMEIIRRDMYGAKLREFLKMMARQGLEKELREILRQERSFVEW